LKRNYADLHMIYMYYYKRKVGDPDICIFTYFLFRIGCSLTSICLSAPCGIALVGGWTSAGL
jgi:hypothetical protein